MLVGEEVTNGGELTNERYEELKAREQFILTVSLKGFGKRSSSYDFRTSGRGGKGIRAHRYLEDGGKSANSSPPSPIEHNDQIHARFRWRSAHPGSGGRHSPASRATKGVTFSPPPRREGLSVEPDQ